MVIRMKINEIFYSIQGEGPQVGMPAWFIRTTGCNLSCSWCDTKYALKDGQEMSIKDIKGKINNGCKNIVITGGEPFLQEDLLDLLKSLTNKNVYIETNGTIYKSNCIGMANFIVSPKPQFLNPNYLKVLKKWSTHAVFKFVIEDRIDFDRALKICAECSKDEDIYFMPMGTTEKTLKENMIKIIKWIKKDAPYVNLTPRLHIYLYGKQRGV